jgi:hypothetical protein
LPTLRVDSVALEAGEVPDALAPVEGLVLPLPEDAGGVESVEVPEANEVCLVWVDVAPTVGAPLSVLALARGVVATPAAVFK